MARRINKATEAEWRGIGEQAKLCRRELFKLRKMIRPFVPLRVADTVLFRVVRHFDRFSAEAEAEMFKRGGPKDTEVFHGDC